MKAALDFKLICCPDCRCGDLISHAEEMGLTCTECGSYFPTVRGRPVLLRSDNQLFMQCDYLDPNKREKIPGEALWVPSPSVNLSAERVLGQLRSRLGDHVVPAVILVVGGGRQRVWLDKILKTNGSQLSVVYSDVDSSADVDLFCDGHNLPFWDGVFDGVVTTAVLEHVLYPEQVAAEIKRVLKPGGLLYSEMPFMQQVHEGAYDFTRYTLSGHRRLLNAFHELDAGLVAGPSTALIWAFENFALAFARRPIVRKLIKVIVRIVFGWIKYFDYMLANRPEAMDGASCTYFLGSKAEVAVGDGEVIAKYVGAKHMKHT